MSVNDSGSDDDATLLAAEDLVRFFRSLTPAARKKYELLAKADLAWGEDVQGERAARAESANDANPAKEPR